MDLSEVSSIPLIMIICYVVIEIIKVIFKKNKVVKKLVPYISIILGGLIGLIIHISDRSYIESKSIYESILIGLISGGVNLGSNQIINKLFKKEKEE